MTRIIKVLFLCSILSCNFLYTDVGSTGWLIFRKIQSPKPKPITTVAAIRGDLLGVLYNPSILSTINNKEIFTIAEMGFSEDITGGLIYGHPLGNSGITAGIFYYDAGFTSIYWIDNAQEVEKKVSLQKDILFAISYGRQLIQGVSGGISAKFASSKFLDTVGANAVAFDIGLSYLPNKKIILSFVAQNFGFSSKFVEKEEKIPTSIYAAIGYFGDVLQRYYYSVGFDVPYLVEEKRLAPGVGVEFGKLPVGIFLGYRTNIYEGNFNVGFSFKIKKIDFSYSYIPTKYLPPSHKISFGFQF
ncbi:MAG: hypothetical protein N2643_03065 [Endomicrobia bacterium]|nr:hypothetical protein [Endomicrobiia bacterium]